jgi:hypothetical protein
MELGLDGGDIAAMEGRAPFRQETTNGLVGPIGGEKRVSQKKRGAGDRPAFH